MNSNKNMKYYSMLIPYVAVLVGLYYFKNAIITLGIYHLGMVIVILASGGFVLKRSNQPNSKIIFVLSLVLFSAAGLIFYLLWPYMFDDEKVRQLLINYGITKQIWVYFLVYFCFVNAILEEFFWRNHFGDESMGITISDVAFAGYHGFVLTAFASIVWTIPVVAVTVFAGWFWRYLYRKRNSLLLPLASHIIADLSILIAVYFRMHY